jgi:hypothetical protein
VTGAWSSSSFIALSVAVFVGITTRGSLFVDRALPIGRFKVELRVALAPMDGFAGIVSGRRRPLDNSPSNQLWSAKCLGNDKRPSARRRVPNVGKPVEILAFGLHKDKRAAGRLKKNPRARGKRSSLTIHGMRALRLDYLRPVRAASSELES